MFEVIKSEIGYAKLEDGTMVYLRVAITGVKEADRLPVGISLTLTEQITLWVESPQELVQKVRDKANPPKEGTHLKNWSIWQFIQIIETKPSIEEIRYKGSDGTIYRASIEIEPTIATRTLEYRDQDNNPIYYI